MPAIHAALGLQLPNDWESSQTVTVEPVKELLLKLIDPKITEHDGALGERGERMASVSLSKQADCLQLLGRLDEAVVKYEESIQQAENRKDFRQVAVGKMHLATAWMFQKRYRDAISLYEETRTLFERQNEPVSVAIVWHQIGIVHRKAGNYNAAEAAYRQSLQIKITLNLTDSNGPASTLSELGNLYDDQFNRPEEAVIFHRQAADIYVELNDLRCEGSIRNNIAITLQKLGQYDEAREEILRAIECYHINLLALQ